MILHRGIQIGDLLPLMAMKHKASYGLGRLDYVEFVKPKFKMALYVASLVVLLMMAGIAMAQTNHVLKKINFQQITGWATVDKTDALMAFLRSCEQMKEDNRAFSKVPKFGGTYQDWQDICRQSEVFAKTQPNAAQITSFFQNHFVPLQVIDPDRKEGLFTGYFEPVVKGNMTQSSEFPVPVYKRPDDLVVFSKAQEKRFGFRYGRMMDGKPTAYYTRKEIENGLLQGKNLELAWLKNRADAFFMQVQGSGRVELPDGSVLRLAYAGKTGLPYTAIGGVLVNDGELDKTTLSMQTIRQWISDNPSKAKELMWKNQSFVFFRQLPETDPRLGPVGAQLVNLTPNTSLAIDRRYWAFGTPIWLDAKIVFDKSDDPKSWRSLLVAQDTGSAIRGYARGDVFWGSGEKAGVIAGQMKAAGKMIVLLPKALANKLVN